MNKVNKNKKKRINFILKDDDNYSSHIYQGFLKKEVPEETFYCANRDYAKEHSNSYYFFPIIDNSNETQTLDKIKFLENKGVLSRKYNWESDFGERVKVLNAKYIEDNSYKELVKYGITRYLRLEFELVYESTGKQVFENKQLKIVIPMDFEKICYSAEYIGMILQNALNGNLQTLRDIDKTFRLKDFDFYGEEGWTTYKCDKCGEIFYTIEEFLCHLIKEKHLDDILNWFPNDREVLRVKKVIEKSLNENS